MKSLRFLLTILFCAVSLLMLASCGGGLPPMEPREDGLYVTARPTITPDGQRLLFAAVQNNLSAIYSSDLNGGNIRLFRSENTDLHSPVHSPDGLHLSFVRANPGETRGTIVVTRSNGNDPRALAPPPGAFDRCPAFTPDNRQIVFQRSYKLDLMQEFRVINTAGGGERLIREDVAWRPHQHQAMPNGKAILFGQMEEIVWKDQKSYRYQIAALDITSGKLHRIGPPGRSRPCLTPNGKTMVFVGEGGKGNVIYVADNEGRNLKQRYGSYMAIESLSIGPHGKNLIFLEQADRYSKRYRLMIMPLASGKPKEIALDWSSLAATP